MDLIRFEILVGDMCEFEDIKDAETLEEYSMHLHAAVSSAVNDYALDHEIVDFEEVIEGV